jgi:hypothetical protein
MLGTLSEVCRRCNKKEGRNGNHQLDREEVLGLIKKKELEEKRRKEEDKRISEMHTQINDVQIRTDSNGKKDSFKMELDQLIHKSNS